MKNIVKKIRPFDYLVVLIVVIGLVVGCLTMTGKRAKVVLILDDPKAQMTYFRRIKNCIRLY